MITKEAFEAWLESSKPGDCITYHHGPNLGSASPGAAAVAFDASLDRRVVLMLRACELREGEKVRNFTYYAFRVSAACPAKLFPRRILEGLNQAPVSERGTYVSPVKQVVRKRRTRAEMLAGVPAFKRVKQHDAVERHSSP